MARSRSLSLMILILTLSGCDLAIRNPSSVNESFWKFEYEYTNQAWGYILHGAVIDDNGDIYSYTYEGTSDRFEPADPDYLTDVEIVDKFSHSPAFFMNIPKDVVAQMDSLAASGSMGNHTNPVQVGNDMGTYRRNYYFYDSNKDKYHRIILKEWGDWEMENTSPVAQTLVEWLETLPITGADGP